MIKETIRQQLEEFIKKNYIEYNSLAIKPIRYSICVSPSKDTLENKAPTTSEGNQQPNSRQDSQPTFTKETIRYSAKSTSKSSKEAKKTTPSLLRTLKFLIIDKFSRSEKPKTFASQLLTLVKAQGMNEIDVYKAANIDRKLFSKIRHSDYHPSRKTAITLALALHLSYEQAKELISLAGYGFSRENKADLIVHFCLENQIYDLMQINELLDEYTNTTL